MATRNIIPRGDGEGNIGSLIKKWIKGWFVDVYVSGSITDGTDSVTVNQLANPPGGGDLLSTNNLSDVANAATSLSNLSGEPAFSKNTAFNKDFGTLAGTVLEGDKNADIILNTFKRHDAATVTDSSNIDLSITGQDITADLINTAVTPGDYRLVNVTVDANGRITAAANGSIGNYAQTANSATINTTGEQSIVGTGVGSLSIPANIFAVGDSFHGKMGGLINATGGGGRSEITIKVKTGTTILASTGVFDLDNATNQGWEVELDFTIAAIGATGTICTNGNFAYTKNGSRQVFGYIFQDVQAIDTTVTNTLDITVEWNVLNGGDDIYSANFVLYKVY
jgi:hypothetical protein